MPDFPISKPIIQVMAKVQHPNVEPNTYNYIGALAQQWTDKSSLANLVQTVHQDFQA